MNSDEFVIEKLIENGFTFDEEKQHSPHFTIINRYGGAMWEVDWLENNGIHAWHKNANAELIKFTKTIADMTMDEICELQEQGIDYLGVVKEIF